MVGLRDAQELGAVRLQDLQLDWKPEELGISNLNTIEWSAHISSADQESGRPTLPVRVAITKVAQRQVSGSCCRHVPAMMG